MLMVVDATNLKTTKCYLMPSVISCNNDLMMTEALQAMNVLVVYEYRVKLSIIYYTYVCSTNTVF